MKKLSFLHLMLCLALLLQLVAFPAFATETDASEPTAAATVEPTAPSVAYGNATVASGCRTLDGQIPLGGSDRILESAQAAFVYEQNTGTVLYSYNPDTTMSPGALTKILTAIVAIENGNLSDQVTISTTNYSSLPAGALNAKLKNGEVMTLEDLLHCMVLSMANDAAISIAEHIAGSQASFVEMMNETARSIGCSGTLFTNCHGIDTAGQYTTARDLARIINYGMKNSTFASIFGTTDYTVPATNKSEARDLTTLNYLMQQLNVTKYIDDRVTGGVATYTSSSGASLACTAKDKNGISLIIVLLGCKRTFASNGYTVTYYGSFDEAWDLLAFGFDGYKICRLLHDGQSMSQFSVAGGENQVVGQTNTAMDAVLPNDAKLDSLILKYNVEGGGLIAPIAKDQKVATLQVWYRTSCVAETELFAMSSVRATEDSQLEIKGASRNDANLTGFPSFLGVIGLVVLVLFTLYLVYNNVRRAIRRNRRRRRRRSRRRSR